MDYKEKFERANSTLMEIITFLIFCSVSHDYEHCVKAIHKAIKPYAIDRLADLKREKEN